MDLKRTKFELGRNEAIYEGNLYEGVFLGGGNVPEILLNRRPLGAALELPFLSVNHPLFLLRA